MPSISSHIMVINKYVIERPCTPFDGVGTDTWRTKTKVWETSLSIIHTGILRFEITGQDIREDDVPCLLVETAMRLSHLYEQYLDQPGGIDDGTDLRIAVEYARAALAMVQAGSEPLCAVLGNKQIGNLGALFWQRYLKTGKMSELHEATELIKLGLAQPADGNDDILWQAKQLSGLSAVFMRWQELTGEQSYLDDAIATARRSVELSSTIPENTLRAWPSQFWRRKWQRNPVDITRASPLLNLGIMLCTRYHRTNELADLEESLRVTKQLMKSLAWRAMSPPFFQLAAATNMANVLMARTVLSEGTVDLDEAVKMMKRAMKSHPLGDESFWQKRLKLVLGRVLERRYELTGKRVDIDRTIKWTRRAVESAPCGKRSGCPVSYLGKQLKVRYGHTGAESDLSEAVSSLIHAWHCQTDRPIVRIYAAALCLDLLAAQGQTQSAIVLAKGAIYLLPGVNIRLALLLDQQIVLTSFSGIAANLCCLLHMSQQPVEALEFLERGRAIIINQILDSRSIEPASTQPPCPRPHISGPKLPEQVLRTLDTCNPRMRLYELEKSVREIMSIPDYEPFLLSQNVSTMQQVASSGAIVVVNIVELGSYAMIVTEKDFVAFHLPRMQAADVRVWVGTQWNGKRAERAQKNRKYNEFLEWLWETCVKHVLQRIKGMDGMPEEGPLRVWWVGSGLASSLPFHAAGIHIPGSTETALSQAISSYTPSFKALGHARNLQKAAQASPGHVFVASMPTTPQDLNSSSPVYADLHHAIEERDRIVGSVSGHLAAKSLDQPSVKQVISELQDCCIAHFACHGYADNKDPSRSGIILQAEHQGKFVRDRLTVECVSKLQLKNARLAYLSACSTAANETSKLSDEVIHLASSFQLAGFPHVVGCLWSSVDRICVDVAARFYSSLLERGLEGPNGWRVAEALRDAVLSVRETELDMPLFWAQFVHYGA